MSRINHQDHGAAQNTEAKQAARPEPVPPLRSGEQRQAALDAARQRNTELKALRTRLQARQLTLAELLALAQSGHAAGRMLVRTALLALPGIRTARASQLMTQAGIDPSRRAGSLTARQRERLLDAVTAVNPELAAAVASTAPATAPAARPQASEASPVEAKTTTPENAGDDRSQPARNRGVRVSREDIQAALLEQVSLEKPLTHKAIARKLGIPAGSDRLVGEECQSLAHMRMHYVECPHRFTESGRMAPGRKPAAHAEPAVRHGPRVTTPASYHDEATSPSVHATAALEA